MLATSGSFNPAAAHFYVQNGVHSEDVGHTSRGSIHGAKMSTINSSLPDSAKRLRRVASEVESPERQVAACLVAHRRLRKLLEHLELDPLHPFTTAAAARVVCFQKNYFCALFKRETGCTFVSWQRAWRVARIAEVLISEDISIARAAERYGYQNMRAFERAFKAAYQVSAREFRREYRTDAAEPEKKRRRLNRSSHSMRREIGESAPGI
jgi:AraC-like DNA-binding protein